MTEEKVVTSKWKDDKRKEECLGRWLDSHYYSKLPNFHHFERIFDRTTQRKGVDVILYKETLPNVFSKTYIDEKASLSYVNRQLPTFAFELKNGQSGAEGWLYNKKYMTDTYILV